MITIPEFVLHTTLNSLLQYVRSDYHQAVDKTQTYLYKLLNGVGFERYNFYEQAVEIICGAVDSPRHLSVELMFNQERQKVPSVHITLPAESQMPGGNGMGLDEGFDNYLFEEEETPTPSLNVAKYARRYSATYNIVIMSDNSNEVIFLHHFLKALLTAGIVHLHLSNLQNISLGARDVNPYNDLSNGLYMRAITVSLQYETESLSIHPSFMPKDILTTGLLKGEVTVNS